MLSGKVPLVILAFRGVKTRGFSAPCRLDGRSLLVHHRFCHVLIVYTPGGERHCEGQVSSVRAWTRTLTPARTRAQISRSKLHRADYMHFINSEFGGKDILKGIMHVANAVKGSGNKLHCVKFVGSF